MVHPALGVVDHLLGPLWSSALPRPLQPADGLIPHWPVIDGRKVVADELGDRV